MVIIDDLNYEIAIPGTFLNYKLMRKDYCGLYSVHNRAAIINDGEVLKEKINISCSSLMPGGKLSILIEYLPADSIFLSDQAPDTFIATPALYINDYTKCDYSWQFEGNKHISEAIFDIKHLPYVQEDNGVSMLCLGIESADSGFRSYESVVVDLYKHYFDDLWLDRYEYDQLTGKSSITERAREIGYDP